MSESTSDAAVDPVERLLDLFLYAPLGLLSKSAASFPDLVERGRSSSTNARVVGQFALGATNVKARSAISEAEKHIAAFLRIVAEASNPTSATDASSDTATAEPTSETQDSALPIPDYETLTAAQILPMLDGLSVEELQRIEDHERSHRGRKTVLNRIKQLRR